MSKEKTISAKQFLQQVSDASGYHLYEVQDVVNSLAICLANNAKLGYSTSIKGIGAFRYKPGHERKGISNMTGDAYDTMSSNSLSLKIDSYMKNMLN